MNAHILWLLWQFLAILRYFGHFIASMAMAIDCIGKEDSESSSPLMFVLYTCTFLTLSTVQHCCSLCNRTMLPGYLKLSGCLDGVLRPKSILWGRAWSLKNLQILSPLESISFFKVCNDSQTGAVVEKGFIPVEHLLYLNFQANIFACGKWAINPGLYAADIKIG